MTRLLCLWWTSDLVQHIFCLVFLSFFRRKSIPSSRGPNIISSITLNHFYKFFNLKCYKLKFEQSRDKSNSIPIYGNIPVLMPMLGLMHIQNFRCFYFNIYPPLWPSCPQNTLWIMVTKNMNIKLATTFFIYLWGIVCTSSIHENDTQHFSTFKTMPMFATMRYLVM